MHGNGAYNPVQRILYTGVVGVLILLIASGVAIWKPVQFQHLTAFFGGYDEARYVHFYAMTALCAFIALHVTLAVSVRGVLRSMITGRPPTAADCKRVTAMRQEERRPRPRLSQFQSQLARIERRLFLKQSLSLGALTLLTGCNLKDDDSVDRLLWSISRWNDRVQEALFDPQLLAPTYTEAEITRPFPFNAYYEEALAPVIDGSSYRLSLSGRIEDKRPWSLGELRALPQTSQITRLVCVEGWSAIGKWGGVPLRLFLERIGADLSARYVGFLCADKYSTSIDMPTALHPQTLLALDFPGAPGETKYGYPVKVSIPTKLGFKNPKYVTEIFVTNDYPGGYWENLGYNWFSGS